MHISRKIDSIAAGNTLKGIAISVVLVNHYLNLNFAGDRTGFANLWISVFFILSGFGLFNSLDRLLASGFTVSGLVEFYYERSTRVFPLLWMAWLIESFVSGGRISFWILLGIHGTAHYWFIPALLQCYLLSPFIYMGMRKNRAVTITVIIAVLAIINYLLMGNHVPSMIAKLGDFVNCEWRGAYFLYVVFFAVGLWYSDLAVRKKSDSGPDRKMGKAAWFWASAVGILLLMIVLKRYSHSSMFFEWAFQVGPLFPIALLCGLGLRNQIGNSLFSFLGSIAYSMYLFHMSFYLVLNSITDVQEDSISKVFLALAGFPAFIFVCYRFEQLGISISNRLRALIQGNPAQRQRNVIDSWGS